MILLCLKLESYNFTILSTPVSSLDKRMCLDHPSFLVSSPLFAHIGLCKYSFFFAKQVVQVRASFLKQI